MHAILKYRMTTILLAIGFQLTAQDFELLKIESAYYPKEAITESLVNGEVGFWEWGGQLAVPQVFKNDKTVLIHKLGYINLRVDMAGSFANTPVEDTKHYHSIIYNLGWVQKLNAKWQTLISLSPTLASDFAQPLNANDLLFQANATVMKTLSEKFQYGFGMAYTTRFGRQLAIPVGMLKYNTPRMELDLILPTKLSLMINTRKPVNVGLVAALNGGLFNNSGDFQPVNNFIDEAGYTRLAVGPVLAFATKDALRFYVSSGLAVGRRLDFIDTSEQIIDRTPENGLFFKMGLAFGPSEEMRKPRQQP